MIKNNTRKVYIVNNFKSDKIEQAIFILKSECNLSSKAYGDVALEAQKIIDEYVLKIENEKHRFIKKKRNFLSSLFTIFLILVAFGALTYFIMYSMTKFI